MKRPDFPSTVLILAALALLAIRPAAAGAEEAPPVFAIDGLELLSRAPHYLDVGVGAFDLFKRDSSSKTSAAARVEVRSGWRLLGLGPALGLLANSDGGLYGYAAAHADLKFGNLVFTPLAGLGAYREGDSSDLGGVFQFRLAVSVSYQFPNQSRLGLSFAHISNAGIHDDNPGEDELHLTYALPF